VTYSLEIQNSLGVWQVYSAATHGYFVKTWTAATGVATISNDGTDGTNALPAEVLFNMRITLKSDDSK